MSKLYFILLVVLLPLGLSAQQEHQYTQYMYNKLSYNPAYAGIRGVPTMTAMYRNQWFKMDGAPRSALISMHAPVFTQRVGVGGVLSHHSIGLHRDVQLTATYSYNVLVTDNFSMRVGVSGNLRVLSLNFSEANPLTSYDPSLADKRMNDAFANFGAGIYGTFQERLYFGFSVPRIVQNSIGLNTDPDIMTARESRHFYGTTGGIIPLGKNLNFLPAVLVKYVKNAPIDVDVTLNIEVKEKVTTGVAYRAGGDGQGESLDLLAYWQVNPRWGLGAAYDLTLTNLRSYTGGSFELLVYADLVKRKKGMTNPRFFM
ncbi:MAG: type IX secretion system membrane protein PorP/SprF [Bacteroidetes bacterium]|nr:MAG: type IX secretion system membrane protein PorP/SprF [Bacteroidota bacterium]